MAIDTFTIKFNEYELETILAAMDDYRHYDDEGMDPDDLIGRTPVLARVTAIEEKISDAFANQLALSKKQLYGSCLSGCRICLYFA